MNPIHSLRLDLGLIRLLYPHGLNITSLYMVRTHCALSQFLLLPFLKDFSAQ